MRLLVSRFFADYRRNPVNLLLLVVVPVVFVVVVAGSLAGAAQLLGGRGGPAVEANTAGWAAGYLAGIAMYFQVSAARDSDRRLVLAGLATWRLVTSRMVTGLGLALLASAAALIALAVRTGLDHPVRAVTGTVMFAIVYLAIGAVAGARIRNPVNGTLIILLVWILDVFFGPTMGALDRPLTRGLPTHFVSLYMVDLPSRHGGRIDDLGWALTWTAAATLVAFLVVKVTVRIAARRHGGSVPGSLRAQVRPLLRAGLRGQTRNPALWALLIVVPTVFVLLADAVTPDKPVTVHAVEGGVDLDLVVSMVRLHGGTMAPIAVASLAALIGLFTVLDASGGDGRLALAGLCPGRLLLVRVAVVVVTTLVAAVTSLIVTATVFDPEQRFAYVGAVLLIGTAYALLGMLMAQVLGRIAGVFVAFLVPFLDLGIAQSPMLRGEPASWAQALPGYGGIRVLIDAAVTPGFDTAGPLLAAGTWIAGLGLFVSLTFRHLTAARRAAQTPAALQGTFIVTTDQASPNASRMSPLAAVRSSSTRTSRGGQQE